MSLSDEPAAFSFDVLSFVFVYEQDLFIWIGTVAVRIAFLFGWHNKCQRPHHLVMQAVKAGHVADVYTLGIMPWKSSPVPYTYASRVICKRASILDSLGIRLFRLLGWQHTSFETRRARRTIHFYESVWNGETPEHYDVAICSGQPLWEVKKHRNDTILVYDCVDRWDAFPNAHPRVLTFEDSLARAADMVWAVTPHLCQHLSERHGAERCHLVPNACDYDHFSSLRGAVHSPRGAGRNLVIGYVGAVSSWFDWDIVRALAEAIPNAVVWIIGSVDCGVPENLPSNIVLEGFVAYEELPRFYAAFDIAIIPFKGKALLKGVSPIKLYEYLAAGKPVVSIPMPDSLHLAEAGVVEVAASCQEFVHACERLLNISSNPSYVHRRRAVAQQNSWTDRWKMCEELIESCRHSAAISSVAGPQA